MNPKKFQKTIKDFYGLNKRSFPWRETSDPYAILVSEIMLQQTQTDRVIPKYEAWLKAFPTFKALADAPLQKVLQQWQGLGYNRRALALQRLAQEVTTRYTGALPNDYEKLLDLPGIGTYTAGAVMAFAFNRAIPIIETNIRTVYIYHFFSNISHGMIHDKEILKLISQSMDTKNPRDWYYALMDYGSHLKKIIGNANVRSKHYTKQTKFEGSNRHIRSSLLHTITAAQISEKNLVKTLQEKIPHATTTQIAKNLLDLEKEGFICKTGSTYSIV